MYYFYDDKNSSSAGPKRPELQQLGCAVMVLGVIGIGILIELTFAWPDFWMGIAACLIPLIIIFAPIIWIILYQKGQ